MMTRIRFHSKRLGTMLSPCVLSLAVLGSSLVSPVGQSAETISVVSVDFRDKVVKAGDRIVVVVTVRNDGRSTLVLPAGALKLRLMRWHKDKGGQGSASETDIGLVSMDNSKEPIQLRAGDNAVLSANVDELQAVYIGPVSATFEVGTDDKTLKGLVVRGSEYKVGFYSGPSDLIRSVWMARSPQEQNKLQPRMRELLLESERAHEKHISNEALGIIDYMGCYAMPYLEAAMADSDPAVRKSAIYVASDMIYVVQFGFRKELRSLASSLRNNAQAPVEDECDTERVKAQFVKIATAALTDSD